MKVDQKVYDMREFLNEFQSKFLLYIIQLYS